MDTEMIKNIFIVILIIISILTWKAMVFQYDIERINNRLKQLEKNIERRK